MEGINARLNEQGGSGGGGGGGGEAAKLAVLITYSELLALANGGQLTPGTWYRITDYQCTTTQDGTQSAGHAFDIIVRADDASRLNENAFAAHHEGDTYFQDCDLEAWVLKYCVTNDTNRFAWADAENGNGVVFYMKDEWGNECGYDFKNILFANSGVSPSPDPGPDPKGATRDGEVGYCYTFTWVTEDGVIQDATIVCQTMDGGEGNYYGVTNNVIKECYMPVYYEGGGDDPGALSSVNPSERKSGEPTRFSDRKRAATTTKAKTRDGETGSLKMYLPFNLFVNTFEDAGGEMCWGCIANTIGENSMFNTFLTWCNCNTLSQFCESNTLSQDCCNNTLSQGCCDNTLSQYCSNNTLSQDCCNNTLSQNCIGNSFSQGCWYNTLSQDCCNNTLSQNSNGITLQAGVQNCEISGNNGTVLAVVYGKTIAFNSNSSYAQFASTTSGGTLRIWNPADTGAS